ncbi:RNA polymerase sigma factor SigI [Peribacillus kribbensis]|uniref:RNA polymerase sigma factor SigI n=1 Tax=Peribacillus kribbensis TaxID=356658 RepID=UPI00047C5D4F|nr:RNA polymerase sigma factor SigI [Peribacillus kribbensis]
MRVMLSLLFAAFKKKDSLEEKIDRIQKGDRQLRNELIENFKPFIAKTASSVCKKYITDSDDEFSIGLIAFNEAIDKYSSEKGRSLIAFSEIMIKRRVIDYLRGQSRQKELLSGDITPGDDEKGEHWLEAEKSWDDYKVKQEQERRRDEILKFQVQLKEYEILFADLVKNSPRHSDARQTAIEIASTLASDPGLIEILFDKKKLPIKELESRFSVSRKTIERNRRYIIAIALILSGDYVFLKDYLKGVPVE